MKIVFLLVGTEGRPKALNGESIRYGQAPASGTDQSVIMVAEYLASTGHDVTVALEKTDKEPCRGVKYTDFTYTGLIDEEVDILVSALWYTGYDTLPFKVTKGLIYWYHMAWVYGIDEMIAYCNANNLKMGFVNISDWARDQNQWSVASGKEKIATTFDVIIPNPIMTDLIDEIIQEKQIERKEKSSIFHAQYSRGGHLADRVVQDLGWEQMFRFDYTDVTNGTDKKMVFEKLLESDYFIFPLYHPNGCVYKDTFSCAVAEAIAAGVIVVTYPLGAIPEYFSDGCSFLIFPHGTDMEKMMTEKVTCDAQYMDFHFNIVDNIKALENNPELKQQIRDRSKNLIKENFSIEKVGKQWIELLENFKQVEVPVDSPFDFFDKIFYVNLDSRADRKAFMEEQFRKYGIKAERYSAVNITKEQNEDFIARGCVFYDDTRPDYAPRIKSCTLSHLHILFQAKLMNYKNYLVLEDDALFDENVLEDLKNCVVDLEQKDWDMFYLGCNPLEYYKDTEYLGRLIRTTTTHAFAVNQKFYDTILNANFFQHYPCIDGFIGNLGRDKNNKIYLSLKNLAIQKEDFSDIEGREVDYTHLIKNKYTYSIVEKPEGW